MIRKATKEDVPCIAKMAGMMWDSRLDIWEEFDGNTVHECRHSILVFSVEGFRWKYD